jgi:hypothetical protein
VNQGFSVSAIGYKTGFNINSPATGLRVDAFIVGDSAQVASSK